MPDIDSTLADQSVNRGARAFSPPGAATSVIDLGEQREQRRKPGRPPKKPADGTAVGTEAPKPPAPTIQLQIARAACSGEVGGEMRADAQGVIWRWSAGIWQIVEKVDGERNTATWLENHAIDRYTTTSVEGGWKQTVRRIFTTCPRKPSPDRGRIVMAMDGGYLEVEKTGRIIAHAPQRDMGLTFKIARVTCPASPGAEYKPKPVPPASRFGKFLAEAQPDEQTRRLVQEQCALSFTGVAHRSIAYWFGDGGNGKSVMQDILAGFHARPVSLNLHRIGEQHGMEQVIGASLLLVAETIHGARWPVDRLKALTSGDPLPIKCMYESEITYAATACMFMISNADAAYDDASDGIADRLVPVRWATKPKHKINRLQDIILKEEPELVLDWFLEGLQRIALRGGEMMPREEWPESVRRGLSDTRRANDPVRRCVEENGWHYAADLPKRPKADVWSAWETWCRDEGLVDRYGNGPMKTPAELHKALRALGGHGFRDMPQNEVLGRDADRVPACRIAFDLDDARDLRDREAAAAAAREKAPKLVTVAPSEIPL